MDVTNTANTNTKETTTLIIGAGQSGLAAAYHLQQRGVDYVMVDSHLRVGDAWRNRWDSLRLFTQARFNNLPGLDFPGPPTGHPTKDEVADYLERYADTFQLNPRLGVTVDDVARTPDGRFLATCGPESYLAANVVVAGGYYRQPRLPSSHADMCSEINQLHSSEYRNAGQLVDGPTLVVGAGNSGLEIAMDLARVGRSVTVAGEDVQQIPFNPDSRLGRTAFLPMVRFVFHHVMSLGNVVGRRAYDQLLKTTSPVVRITARDLAEVGVERAPRLVGVENGQPKMADGSVRSAANVIWCTGFQPDFSWIPSLGLQPGERPSHQRGVSDQEAGLYFMGQFFQYAMSSSLLTGVGRDAEFVANAIAQRKSRSGPGRPSTDVVVDASP